MSIPINLYKNTNAICLQDPRKLQQQVTYFKILQPKFSIIAATPPQRSSKGQHSAPRGGPPRSWTNDDLQKALENVWNRRMTTSQASRVYGIPYNSLLMYVRGKYGKSLKLDKLKETTQAANDNLNIIGNSRSTPKEKIQATQNPDGPKKNKHSSGSSNSSGKSQGSKNGSSLIENFENNPFMAAMMPLAESRVKDVVQQMQTRQALLDHSERLKEIEKQLGSEQAKLLMPFFTSGNLTQNTDHETKEKENTAEDTNLPADKERQVQEILIEATKKKVEENTIEDDNKNNVNPTEVLKPIEVKPPGGEISA